MNFKGDLKESTRSDRRGSDPIGSDNVISQDSKKAYPMSKVRSWKL